jgi:hypothetical protein
VAGGWRTLRNEEPRNLYSSLNIIEVIREDKMVRVSSTRGRNEKCLQNSGLKT